MYLHKTFTFNAPNSCGEECGKIVDVVVPAKEKSPLYFKFFNHQASRRAKKFHYLPCTDILSKNFVRWDNEKLTGKSLIGRRVQDLFKVDGGKNLWYEGYIKNYDGKKKEYQIRYCDGDERWVTLEKVIPSLRRGEKKI